MWTLPAASPARHVLREDVECRRNRAQTRGFVVADNPTRHPEGHQGGLFEASTILWGSVSAVQVPRIL